MNHKAIDNKHPDIFMDETNKVPVPKYVKNKINDKFLTNSYFSMVFLGISGNLLLNQQRN